MIRFNVYAIHKEYWKNPDKFNSDRWLVEGFESSKEKFIYYV
jgi:hypothetical protein